jgi:SAM-dependent methyltransferase
MNNAANIKDYYRGELEFWRGKPSSYYEYLEKDQCDFISDGAVKVLDLCCGRGTLGLILAGRKKESVCADFLFEMAKFCRENAEGSGLEAAAVCADAFNLPFKKNVFDAVICTSIFELYDDVRGVLKGIREALREKGEIVILLLNDRPVPRRWVRKHYGGMLRYRFIKRKEDVSDIICGMGFEKVKEKYIGFSYLAAFLPVRVLWKIWPRTEVWCDGIIKSFLIMIKKDFKFGRSVILKFKAV